MRTPLLWTLPALLAALPAQDPTPRPAAEQPPTATIGANSEPSEAELRTLAEAAKVRLADQRQPRVVFDQPEANGPLWAVGVHFPAVGPVS